MSISLQKGQKIDLTKGNVGLSRLMIGLGWDPVQNNGGFIGKLFGSAPSDFDCDASVLMLNQNGKLSAASNVIYFGNLRSLCGSVIHTGDNLTGEGDGDDEQILVDLMKVPQDVHELVFVVNIYDCVNRRQDFGMLQNAYIRVVDSEKQTELLKFSLNEKYPGKTALIVGKIYRYNGEWKFNAIGEGTTHKSIKEIVAQYAK